MQIRYRIKRFDLVRAYFYNLRHSARTRLVVLGASAVIFAFQLFTRALAHGQLLLPNLLYAAAWALAVILVIPVLNYITAKTQQRTLSINADGIETKIGHQEGTIPWASVDSIAAAGDRVVITRKSANFFTIPARAFKSEDERQAFLNLAKKYHQLALTRF